MAMSIDDFWKLLQEIQGTSTDLTDAVKAIAKNEKTVSETLFSNIIDQQAYNSQDYVRFRSFLRDWYAAHRSITKYQANISDVYQMPNDQLDDLFQSFGYNYSSGIRDPNSNNAPLTKVNFFLDLVNLYKRKGTPSALVDVLQYYSITDLDLYELSLQFEDRLDKNQNDLIFKGRVVSGTTGDTTPIYLPFDLLTQGDPHWFQTESQIRSLYNSNIINFPSQSPYFAVKPIFDEVATDAATGILQRRVQDQYETWKNAGFPAEDTSPLLTQNAVISITGDECSLLTLYLASIYTFFKEFSTGYPADRFICYDGTNTEASAIITEFRDVTSQPSTRAELKSKYNQYLDIFSRDISLNFLQDSNDAGNALASLNPTVKANLDGLATDINTVLGSLLKDLGEWVRGNISYGFINMSYILFGIDSLFSDLRNVVEFFKPYRARFIPIELLQFSNRLLNSIVIEDSLSISEDIYIYDYLVGDSAACCIDSTCSNKVSPREYYDCGSYHDIGAVIDNENVKMTIYDNYYDYMRCPASDTTGYVTSEILELDYSMPNVVNISNDTTSLYVLFVNDRASSNYYPVVNLFNEEDTNPSIIPYVITSKSVNGFIVNFEDTFPTENYHLTWDIIDQTNYSGIQIIDSSSSEVSVSFPSPMLNPNYSLSVVLENQVDSNISFFRYTVVEKTVNGFTVKFSDAMPTGNYSLNWTTFEYGRNPSGSVTQDGLTQISNGSNTVTVPFVLPYETVDNYTVALSIVNTDDTSVSTFGFIVKSKDIYGFTVLLSGAVPTSNYYISWSIPISSTLLFDNFLYRQTGQMRDFDEDGTFDCTHGMDFCDILVEDVTNYLLQENGDYLLQEDGNRIVL